MLLDIGYQTASLLVSREKLVLTRKVDLPVLIYIHVCLSRLYTCMYLYTCLFAHMYVFTSMAQVI